MRAYSKRVTRYFVEIDGEEFEQSNLLYTLNLLDDSSYMCPILISNHKLARVLEDRRVISCTVRGSYLRGSKYYDFMKELSTLLNVEALRRAPRKVRNPV